VWVTVKGDPCDPFTQDDAGRTPAPQLGTQLAGAELVRRFAEMLGEVAYHPQIFTSGDLRVA